MSETKKRNISMDCDVDIPTQEKKKTNEFNPKNYLDVKLDNNQDEKSIIIRLLPFDGESSTPFKIVQMHTLKVPKEISDSEWKSYVCIEKNSDVDHNKFGKRCPFCELNHSAYDKMVEAKKNGNLEEAERWKKISFENKSQDVCIVRCIERGAEADGPKFWKFNVRSDKQDPMNKIRGIRDMRKQESIDIAKEENNGILPSDFIPDNILDLYEGKDLKLVIKAVYDKEGKRTRKTSIEISDYGKKKPITADDELLDKWIDDEKKWLDVFVVKPYDYLSLVIDGEVPYYDKSKEKWVSKDKKIEENKEKKEETEREADEKIKAAEEKINSNVDEDAEELPF